MQSNYTYGMKMCVPLRGTHLWGEQRDFVKTASKIAIANKQFQ
jgi:hypothetical protein